MGISEGQVSTERCVTISEVSQRLVDLADDYAARLMESMPTAASEQELRQGLSGAFISFLAEALTG